MSKKKTLQKRTAVQAGIALAIAAGFGGVMLMTGTLADDAEQNRMRVESTLNQDRSQLATLRSQLERSGDAEKRFVDMQLYKTGNNYSASSDAMKEWLRVAKDRYRFGNSFKLKLSSQKPSDKQELQSFNYNVFLRDEMEITLDAISDMHVYSFIQQMDRAGPGFIRITRLDIERKSDMDNEMLRQMVSGLAPELVSATIQFVWVGLDPKETPPVDAVPPPAGGV